MKPTISDLWRWSGPLDRGTYAFWGILLAGLKYNLDRLLAASFGYSWTPFSYLRPGQGMEDIGHMSPNATLFFTALVVLAVPFLWAGAGLTLRRLRTLGWPDGLLVLFFLPLVNALLFVLLAVAPGTAEDGSHPAGRLSAWLDRVVPHGGLGSAALAVLVTAPIGALMIAFGVYAAGDYGWGMFVGVPFLLGLNAALIHNWHAPRPLASSLMAGAMAVGVLGVLLLAVAMEGILCLAMATPIALTLALLGAAAGWAMRRRPDAPAPLPPAMLLLVAVLPMMMGAEARDGNQAPLFAVVTTVEVDAPPETVWRHVVSFPDLPPPEETLFKLGVAYPVRARIDGVGVGAVRKCEFSTGPFVEPITHWEPPTRLAFGVTAQPKPMGELSPYQGVDAPHLDDFLRSERGQFLLTPLPGGRTKLEGTTWYRHRIWPAPYWRVWSDAIIHQIHGRVLRHVKDLAEAPSRR